MRTPPQLPDGSADARTPFQRFEALARRILTTPKTDLLSGTGKAKPAKPPAKKRK